MDAPDQELASCRLQNHIGKDEVAFVRQGHMMRRHASCSQPGGEFGRAFDVRLAARVAQHGYVAQRHGRAQAGSGRLGERLLGGEAFGQKARRVAAGVIPRVLGGGEDAVCVVLAVAGEAVADAPGVEQVSADAVDHGDTFTGRPAARIFSANASSHSTGSADSRPACGCIEGRARPYSSTPRTGMPCCSMRFTAARYASCSASLGGAPSSANTQVCSQVGHSRAATARRSNCFSGEMRVWLTARMPAAVALSNLNHTSPFNAAIFRRPSCTRARSARLPLVISTSLAVFLSGLRSGPTRPNSAITRPISSMTCGKALALVGSPLPDSAMSFSRRAPSGTRVCMKSPCRMSVSIARSSASSCARSMSGAVPRVRYGTWQYTHAQLQALLGLRLTPTDTPPARRETTG